MKYYFFILLLFSAVFVKGQNSLNNDAGERAYYDHYDFEWHISADNSDLDIDY